MGIFLSLLIKETVSSQRTIKLISLNDQDTYFFDKPIQRLKRESSNEEKLKEITDLIDKVNEQMKNRTSDSLPFPDEVIDEKKHNVTTDNHTYYNISYINTAGKADEYWINMANEKNAVKHDMLSNAHRRAATVRLSFKFPFYGYKIENITIATGGFLFLGEAVHAWLAATQYIAPLMANFNTSIHPNSSIYYLDQKTSFSVQWDNVYLQEVTVNSSSLDANGKQIRNPIEKPFSFQATLKDNGDIIFIYKQVPFEISKINEDKHPVKVGISDAYIIDRTIFFIRRKTIYEYHKAELKNKQITNDTVIYFKALPTCNTLNDCQSCISKLNTNFECSWCESTKKCSDGYDRHRQEWIKNRCDDTGLSKCNANESASKEENHLPNSDSSINTETKPAITPINSNDINQEKLKSKSNAKEQTRSHKSGFVTILILLILISVIAYYAAYAYRNPQSTPGQFLIKYRPTNWRSPLSSHSDQSRFG